MMNLYNYKILSLINIGTFGNCYKVQNKLTEKISAWKTIHYGNVEGFAMDSLISELNLWKEFKHFNIVQCFDYTVNKETQTVYIDTELCDSGDLSILLSKCKSEYSRLEEKFIWSVLYQICKAIQFCHNKGAEGTVVHCDINPANVCLNSAGIVKLNFDLTKILQRNEYHVSSIIGKSCYMNPKIIKDLKSDVWAIGCLIYEMSTLELPFEANKLNENMYSSILTRIPDYYSSDLQEIICFILNAKSDFRPDIELILRNPVLVRNVPDNHSDFRLLISLSSTSHQKETMGFSPLKNALSTSILELSLFNKASVCSSPKPLYHPTHNRKNNYQLKTLDFGNLPGRDQFEKDPDVITQNIFNHALQNRLHAIRAQETLLRQKEADLNAKENDLNDREKRLVKMEKALNEWKTRVVSLLKKAGFQEKMKPGKSLLRKTIRSRDDTYCSIEPNDTVIKPTIAKLDLAAMSPPKPLSRKVTFRSQRHFMKYNIDNIPPRKTTNESTRKRRSLLSIFGKNLKRSENDKKSKDPLLFEVEPSNLAQIWTSQNKKAAFNKLAAINAGKTGDCSNSLTCELTSNKFKTSSQRRSMVISSREQILL